MQSIFAEEYVGGVVLVHSGVPCDCHVSQRLTMAQSKGAVLSVLGIREELITHLMALQTFFVLICI